MNLYEIQIPVHANGGKRYELARRTKFQDWLLQYAGGYSRNEHAIIGAWRNVAGEVYIEQMMSYHVACSAQAFEKIMAAAFSIFPDQHAIFTAQIGQADIRNRVVPIAQAAE